MVTIQVEGGLANFEATVRQTETFSSRDKHWLPQLVSGSKTISIRSLTAMGTLFFQMDSPDEGVVQTQPDRI